jgi:hypothetical protein
VLLLLLLLDRLEAWLVLGWRWLDRGLCGAAAREFVVWISVLRQRGGSLQAGSLRV